MGTVRGNMGTVLEHVLLSEAVHWVPEPVRRTNHPLLYVDTHAIAPLNQPIGRDFNLLNRLRASALSESGTDCTVVYSEVFRDRWMPGIAEWYPTHFVHATRVANAQNVGVCALLFENDSSEARPSDASSEDRRGEIASFLKNSKLQQNVGLSVLAASLASPGDFRNADG